MKDYYINNLSGNHLHQVYALADDSVTGYLQGEIDYCLAKIKPGDRILELGCGYGRIIKALASDIYHVSGIDNAPANIDLAIAYLDDHAMTDIKLMSVDALDYDDASFDLVLCMQNGLSAFGLDPLTVIKEACRVLKPTGRLICCTYSEAFWDTRLRWFRLQSDAGLLGSIDEENTKDGVIKCVDGFVSSAITTKGFEDYAEQLNLNIAIDNLTSGSLVAEYTKS